MSGHRIAAITRAYVICLVTLIVMWLSLGRLDGGTIAGHPEPQQPPPAIKKAIHEMGPNYHYRILDDGTLQVNKGDGEWLKLKY